MQNQPFQLFSLAGKTAIVTGGTGLIGRKYCEALLQAGANVVVADISLTSTQEADTPSWLENSKCFYQKVEFETAMCLSETLIDAMRAVVNVSGNTTVEQVKVRH